MPKNKSNRYWLIFRDLHVQPHTANYSTLQAAFDALIDWQSKGVPCMVWDSVQKKYVLFPATDVPA